MAVVELVFAVVGAWTLMSLFVAGFILLRRTAHHRRHAVATTVTRIPTGQRGVI